MYDATSELYSMLFVAEEGAQSSFLGLAEGLCQAAQRPRRPSARC
jgi:hypothetical protein